jgi:dsRNA-specific ribonuclease
MDKGELVPEMMNDTNIKAFADIFESIVAAIFLD